LFNCAAHFVDVVLMAIAETQFDQTLHDVQPSVLTVALYVTVQEEAVALYLP
jgi:hypothetical protein